MSPPPGAAGTRSFPLRSWREARCRSDAPSLLGRQRPTEARGKSQVWGQMLRGESERDSVRRSCLQSPQTGGPGLAGPPKESPGTVTYHSCRSVRAPAHPADSDRLGTVTSEMTKQGHASRVRCHTPTGKPGESHPSPRHAATFQHSRERPQELEAHVALP